MQYLYYLRHSYTYGADEMYTERKSLGVFSSREMASSSIAYYITQPGFCDYDVSCFEIIKCKIDEAYLEKIIITRY
ncbi:MAG: hypothetical protein LUC97_02985 [Clostridiales bacterium]|nr:hypothetical protein [Clostridiales bacterium]